MPIPELTRRVFLRRSVRAAGALAALPALGAACVPGRPDEPTPEGLRVLDAGEHRVLAAVTDAFVPEGGVFEAGAATVGLATRIDALLVDEPPGVVAGLRSALALVEWAGGPYAGHLGRFSRLGPGARGDVLGALAASRFDLAREIFAGLKQLCLFAFYAQDASWPGVGYAGPWLEAGGRPGAARAGVA